VIHPRVRRLPRGIKGSLKGAGFVTRATRRLRACHPPSAEHAGSSHHATRPKAELLDTRYEAERNWRRRSSSPAPLFSPGPDAGGEAFDGGEAEALVELDGGVVVGSYGQR